jgi:hypothetical protein
MSLKRYHVEELLLEQQGCAKEVPLRTPTLITPSSLHKLEREIEIPETPVL